MLEEIIRYLEQHPDGVSSMELAKKFLKLQDTQSSFAHITISSILSKNKRCFIDSQGSWHAREISSSCNSLEQLPLTAIFILGNTEKNSRQIYYIALWKILPEPQYLVGGWAVDEEFLQKTGKNDLLSIYDNSFFSSGSIKPVLDVINQSEFTIPVYLSASQHNLLKFAFVASGMELTDDSIHMCELFQCADIKIDNPEDLGCCCSALLGKTSDNISAFKQGQLFAECIREVIRILMEKGIYLREDIDNILIESRKSLISGKEFSYEQICALPSSRAVFGFKDKNGKYLYIGKTNNLKRKILGFLRNNTPNSARLQFLIEQSHSLITHQCASELEALLYEHRLILKHSPQLNPKTDFHAKTPAENPEDCVILMPHTKPELIMTFWTCKNKKIKIKALDLRNSGNFCKEFEDFFNPESKSSELPDPMEMALAFNWIKENEDQVLIIPADGTGSGSEILNSIEYYWNQRLNK